MKNIFQLIACVTAFAFTGWHYNLDEAKQIAAKEHKHILLNFSGSDWCGPCIEMHKQIFDNLDFQKFANEDLIMVNADFPRRKKDRLSEDQQVANDKMADEYNQPGIFPYTVLLDANGKVLKRWEGYPKGDVASFIEDVKQAINASNQ